MNEERIKANLLADLHKSVQRLRAGGMSVDSSLVNTTSVIDGRVSYTTTLTLTGDFSVTVVDERDLDVVRQEALEDKAELEAEAQEALAHLEDVIQAVESVDTPDDQPPVEEQPIPPQDAVALQAEVDA